MNSIWIHHMVCVLAATDLLAGDIVAYKKGSHVCQLS
jgi:hypothetical protein